MNKLIKLCMALLCLLVFASCNKDETTNAYFTGQVTEKLQAGCLVNVTDAGNTALTVDGSVEVKTDIEGCPAYNVGDLLKIIFDGRIAESYPPQVLHVKSIQIVNE